jgi:hypothetical protein
MLLKKLSGVGKGGRNEKTSTAPSYVSREISQRKKLTKLLLFFLCLFHVIISLVIKNSTTSLHVLQYARNSEYFYLVQTDIDPVIWTSKKTCFFRSY